MATKTILQPSQRIYGFFSKNFKVSDKTKELLKTVAEKIRNFIKGNISLIFFGLTLAFSYYMAPLNAISYLETTGYSLKKLLIESGLISASIFVVKNAISKHTLTKSQDDKINYLTGIINVFQTILSPMFGLIFAVGSASFIVTKTISEMMFPSDEDIYILNDLHRGYFGKVWSAIKGE